MHEFQMHDEVGCFITLTYDDQHLPFGGTLVKHHFQDFMKRLRKRISPQRVRYYYCGEYGDQTDRPHYHALLFGFEFEDAELLGTRDGNPVYVSETLAKLWPFGLHEIGSITFESAGYVARYILKKQLGKDADEAYATAIYLGDYQFYRTPEFTDMSRRPGIGYSWVQEYAADVFPSDEMYMPGRGIVGGVPRYYMDIHEMTNPGEVEQVRQKRRDFFYRYFGDLTPARLKDRETVQEAKLQFLTRSL